MSVASSDSTKSLTFATKGLSDSSKSSPSTSKEQSMPQSVDKIKKSTKTKENDETTSPSDVHIDAAASTRQTTLLNSFISLFRRKNNGTASVVNYHLPPPPEQYSFVGDKKFRVELWSDDDPMLRSSDTNTTAIIKVKQEKNFELSNINNSIWGKILTATKRTTPRVGLVPNSSTAVTASTFLFDNFDEFIIHFFRVVVTVAVLLCHNIDQSTRPLITAQQEAQYEKVTPLERPLIVSSMSATDMNSNFLNRSSAISFSLKHPIYSVSFLFKKIVSIRGKINPSQIDFSSVTDHLVRIGKINSELATIIKKEHRINQLKRKYSDVVKMLTGINRDKNHSFDNQKTVDDQNRQIFVVGVSSHLGSRTQKKYSGGVKKFPEIHRDINPAFDIIGDFLRRQIKTSRLAESRQQKIYLDDVRRLTQIHRDVNLSFDAKNIIDDFQPRIMAVKESRLVESRQQGKYLDVMKRLTGIHGNTNPAFDTKNIIDDFHQQIIVVKAPGLVESRYQGNYLDFLKRLTGTKGDTSPSFDFIDSQRRQIIVVEASRRTESKQQLMRQMDSFICFLSDPASIKRAIDNFDTGLQEQYLSLFQDGLGSNTCTIICFPTLYTKQTRLITGTGSSFGPALRTSDESRFRKRNMLFCNQAKKKNFIHIINMFRQRENASLPSKVFELADINANNVKTEMNDTHTKSTCRTLKLINMQVVSVFEDDEANKKQKSEKNDKNILLLGNDFKGYRHWNAPSKCSVKHQDGNSKVPTPDECRNRKQGDAESSIASIPDIPIDGKTHLNLTAGSNIEKINDDRTCKDSEISFSVDTWKGVRIDQKEYPNRFRSLTRDANAASLNTVCLTVDIKTDPVEAKQENAFANSKSVTLEEMTKCQTLSVDEEDNQEKNKESSSLDDFQKNTPSEYSDKHQSESDRELPVDQKTPASDECKDQKHSNHKVSIESIPDIPTDENRGERKSNDELTYNNSELFYSVDTETDINFSVDTETDINFSVDTETNIDFSVETETDITFSVYPEEKVLTDQREYSNCFQGSGSASNLNASASLSKIFLPVDTKANPIEAEDKCQILSISIDAVENDDQEENKENKEECSLPNDVQGNIHQNTQHKRSIGHQRGNLKPPKCPRAIVPDECKDRKRSVSKSRTEGIPGMSLDEKKTLNTASRGKKNSVCNQTSSDSESSSSVDTKKTVQMSQKELQKFARQKIMASLSKIFPPANTKKDPAKTEQQNTQNRKNLKRINISPDVLFNEDRVDSKVSTTTVPKRKTNATHLNVVDRDIEKPIDDQRCKDSKSSAVDTEKKVSLYHVEVMSDNVQKSVFLPHEYDTEKGEHVVTMYEVVQCTPYEIIPMDSVEEMRGMPSNDQRNSDPDDSSSIGSAQESPLYHVEVMTDCCDKKSSSLPQLNLSDKIGRAIACFELVQYFPQDNELAGHPSTTSAQNDQLDFMGTCPMPPKCVKELPVQFPSVLVPLDSTSESSFQSFQETNSVQDRLYGSMGFPNIPSHTDYETEFETGLEDDSSRETFFGFSFSNSLDSDENSLSACNTDYDAGSELGEDISCVEVENIQELADIRFSYSEDSEGDLGFATLKAMSFMTAQKEVYFVQNADEALDRGPSYAPYVKPTIPIPLSNFEKNDSIQGTCESDWSSDISLVTRYSDCEGEQTAGFGPAKRVPSAENPLDSAEYEESSTEVENLDGGSSDFDQPATTSVINQGCDGPEFEKRVATAKQLDFKTKDDSTENWSQESESSDTSLVRFYTDCDDECVGDKSFNYMEHTRQRLLGHADHYGLQEKYVVQER